MCESPVALQVVVILGYWVHRMGSTCTRRRGNIGGAHSWGGGGGGPCGVTRSAAVYGLLTGRFVLILVSSFVTAQYNCQVLMLALHVGQ